MAHNKKSQLDVFSREIFMEIIGLSTEETGAYICLFLAAWSAPNGGLVDEDCRLARIAGLSTRKWRRVRPRVLDNWRSYDGTVYCQLVAEIKRQTVARSHIPQCVADAVWAKTDGLCSYCGVELTTGDNKDSQQFHIDHFIPFSEGGSDEIDNLFPSCRKCNCSKGSRIIQ